MDLLFFLLIYELFNGFKVAANISFTKFPPQKFFNNNHQGSMISDLSNLIYRFSKNSSSKLNYNLKYNIDTKKNNLKFYPIYDLTPEKLNDGLNDFIDGNLSTNQNYNKPISFENNFKHRKEKILLGKKLLFWKRNSQRGFVAFLMLCEPDTNCVSPQTKSAIVKCMNSGGSALANQFYNSCSNQNRIRCTDRDSARRLLSCLRLQNGNNVLITPQSRACIRQVVTLSTWDCFVKIFRQKPKYRLGNRYTTIKTDTGSVTSAGIDENNPNGNEDSDSESDRVHRALKREIFLDSETNESKTINDSIIEMANDAFDSVTQYYDREISNDSNRNFSDDLCSEKNENYENYNSSNEVIINLKSNSTSKEVISDDDEFEEITDNEDEDNVLIGSAEMSTSSSFFDQQTSQIN